MRARWILTYLLWLGACGRPPEPIGDRLYPDQAFTNRWHDGRWPRVVPENAALEHARKLSGCTEIDIATGCFVTKSSDSMPGESLSYYEVENVEKNVAMRFRMFYPECSSDVADAATRNWFCEEEGDACAERPRGSETMDQVLQAAWDFGWVHAQPQIFLLCFESCTDSTQCSGIEEQGDLSRKRCQKAAEHVGRWLENKLGSQKGWKDLIKVNTVAVACDSRSEMWSPRSNFENQRVTLLFEPAVSPSPVLHRLIMQNRDTASPEVEASP
jgi:hypothetical protein